MRRSFVSVVASISPFPTNRVVGIARTFRVSRSCFVSLAWDLVHLVHVSIPPWTVHVRVCSCASCSSFLTSWVKFPPIMVRLAFPPSPPLPFGDPLPNPAMPIPLSPSPSHPLLVGISRWVHPVWVGVAPGSSLIFHLDGTHRPDPTEIDTERRERVREREGLREERDTHTHTEREGEREREIERGE